jgi:hypothetical protein
MQLLIALFGEGKDLSSLQMGMRAAVAFFGALIFIRIPSRWSNCACIISMPSLGPPEA